MGDAIRVRASAFGDLFDCPARFEAKHIMHLRTPNGPGAVIGTAVHAGSAVFDRARMDGNPVTVNEAAGAVVDAVNKPSDENGERDPVVWGGDELTQKEAESIALSLHTKYCATIAPTQEYKGIEVRCESLLIPELGLELTGTTDRIGRTLHKDPEGQYGIRDMKTGKTAVAADGTVNTAPHKTQIGIYELIAEHASGIPITLPGNIIGMTSAKTPGSQRVGMGEVVGARAMLLGDGVQRGSLEIASEMIHRGLFPGNPRSYLCGEKFCPIWKDCRWRK